jgi:hypothetical protein
MDQLSLALPSGLGLLKCGYPPNLQDQAELPCQDWGNT